MTLAADHLRFLKQCHRRWMLWRIVECAGIGAAIGSAVGFFILPILFLREQSSIRPECIVLFVGTVAGSLFGLTRRPTLIQTALEADRQLKLNDLLSTAVMWGNKTVDDGFAEMVRAQAEEICRRLSPNELIVRRLGGRAWGGIGIATSLLLTLAMMTTQPQASQAGVDALNGISNLEKTMVPSTEPPSPRLNQTARQSSPFTDQSGRRASDHSLGERDDNASAGARNATASRTSGNNNTRGDGTGSEAGRTSDASIPRLVQGSNSATSDENGKLSQGSGKAGRDGSGNPPSLATGGVVKDQAKSTSPWQSATWSADRAEAMKGVQSGKTPDEYRDLVREYFNLQQQ